MKFRETIASLEGQGDAGTRFGAFKTSLKLPSDVELFYAFGSPRNDKTSNPPRTPKSLLMEPQTRLWWQDYSVDPTYRLRDPVRDAVKNGLETINWHDFSRRPAAKGKEYDLWERVWSLGVQGGVTVPLHDARRGLYGSFSVISFGDRSEFDAWYSGARGMLAASAYCFHHALDEGEDTLKGTASPLTRRERECLTLVANGYCSKKIACLLELSPRTVDLHIARCTRRLGARNRVEAVSIALKHQLIEP